MSEPETPDSSTPPAVETPADRAVDRQSAETASFEPKTPLSAAGVFWYSVANLGYGAFYALNNAVLPLFLQRFTHNAILLGLMGSTHSIEGVVIQPCVGVASDRLRTPIGRRRPFLLAFVPLAALLVAATPLAGRLDVGIRLAVVIAAVVLFTILFNLAWDPYQALMPDITPVPQRGRVTALYTLAGVLGQAGLMLLDLPPTEKFVITAGLMLVTTLITCAMVREPDIPPEPRAFKNPFHDMAVALRGVRTLRQAGISLVALFFSGVGIGAVLPFLTLFVKQVTACTDQQAQQMFLVLMISTAVSVLPFGKLADRIGPKPVLMIGMGLIALASLNALWIHTLPQVAVVLTVAGLGNAAQSASAFPLLTELVPGEETGFYTGLQSTALSLAAPVTAILTGDLINRGGYRVIFGVCAVGMIAAVAFLQRVNREKAVLEIGVRIGEERREA